MKVRLTEPPALSRIAEIHNQTVRRRVSTGNVEPLAPETQRSRFERFLPARRQILWVESGE